MSDTSNQSGRIVVTPQRLKELWFLPAATGMIHDHQTGQKVVVMDDGTEYACPLGVDPYCPEHGTEPTTYDRCTCTGADMTPP